MALYGLNKDLPVEHPIEIDRESLQAFGLCQWYPGLHPHGAGGGLVKEYVSGFKNGSLNGNRSYPDAPNVSHAFGSAFPMAALFFDGASVTMTGVTYSGGSASGPQNGPQPFPIAPPFSVAIWVRPWAQDGVIWWHGRQAVGIWYAHYIGYSNTSKSCSASSVDNNVFRSASSANNACIDRQWNHICAVWHSTTDRRIYVNGVFQSQDTTTSNPDLSAGSLIMVGAANANAFVDNYWKGHVCDLRMYRRAISAPEVMAIYNPLTRFDLFKSQRYSRPFPGVSVQSFTGTFSGSFGAATGSLSGTFYTNHTGTFTESFSAPTGSFISTFYTSHTGTFTEDLGAVTGSFAGTFYTSHTGTFSEDLGPVTGSITSTFYTSHTGTFSEDFGAITGSISAVYSQDRIGTLSGSLGAVVGSLSGNFTTLHTGSFDENFGALTGSLTGTFFTTHTGEFTESLGPVTGSFSGTVANNIGTFSETLGGMTGTISGTFYTSHTGTFSETFGPVTGSIVSTFTPAPVTGSFTEIFGAMTGSLSGTFSTEIIYDPGTPPMDVFWVGSFW